LAIFKLIYIFHELDTADTNMFNRSFNLLGIKHKNEGVKRIAIPSPLAVHDEHNIQFRDSGGVLEPDPP
jgi:hypothetical protein